MENAVEIVELEKKYYIGLELRTTNQEGRSHTEIPRHWERFFMEGITGKIPGKIGGMLAHYTDYAGDWMQPYTMAAGFEVSSLDEVPEGLVGREVPAAKYAVYTAKGKFPDALLKVWQEIWSSDLKRAYKSDFEVYPEDFDPAGDPEIKVYISLAE